MNNKKIVVIVVFVCFFALYMPTSTAQEKLDDYPIKFETLEELHRLFKKHDELGSDIALLWQPDLMKSVDDSIQVAALVACNETINGPIQIILSMILLENKHNHYPYEVPALFWIKEITEGFLSDRDSFIKEIDGLITEENKFKSTSHSSIIVLFNELKEYARESERLMQKIIKELENTIEIIKANEPNP